MSSPREFADFLEDIRASAIKAQCFVAGMDFAAFAKDDKTGYAVVRALEIIGEAARHVPQEFRDQHPAIPWRAMTGIRDKLIHDYTSVNLEIVWQTLIDDLPPLITQIGGLIDGLTGER
jgi:uncharacterized protein with HEPN domain